MTNSVIYFILFFNKKKKQISNLFIKILTKQILIKDIFALYNQNK